MQHDTQRAKALILLGIHFYPGFQHWMCFDKKDLHNFMAIISTIVTSQVSIIRILGENVLEGGRSGWKMILLLCPGAKLSISHCVRHYSKIFISSLSFPLHPDDTCDSLWSLYILNINQINCAPLKIKYLPKGL